MNAFQARCIQLRKRGYSLSDIVKITGRPKTSVYFHIKALPLSEERQNAIRKESAVRARALALKRRGCSKRPFQEFDIWNESTVFVVAHLLFDGEISRSGCIYNNRNTVLIRSFETAMQTMYAFAPRRWINPLTGVCRISYFNVALARYITAKAENLLESAPELSKSLQRIFLRAFFDDEGCMDVRLSRNIRRIRGYQKNVTVLQLIQKLLANFGITARLVRPNEVVISGKVNLERFRDEIGFSRGVRINSNRSNSIWRESIEKRELLRRAIASFQH